MTDESPKFIDYVLDRYMPSIGLEIHCQLNTQTKLFCSCPNGFGSGANTTTCPICLGYPGTLPVVNQKAIELAVKFGVAVKGKINQSFSFARKHYFYPDLPKGYQITQHREPFCLGGFLPIDEERDVRLHHVHIEEDAGKLIHEGHWSYVDLNRAGVPLIEIVTEPELHTAADAAAVLRNLRQLVRFTSISDGNMEEGSIRCDVNISLMPRGKSGLGTKCEIKNVNSIKNVERAVLFEIMRQGDMLERKEPFVQSTLSFDAVTGKTSVMRTKEDSQDYRYMDDPDLPVIEISFAKLTEVKRDIPELPHEKRRRFSEEYGLSLSDSSTLVSEPEVCQYFERTMTYAEKISLPVFGKQCANWILTEVLREANDQGWKAAVSRVSEANLAELIHGVQAGKLSNTMAKSVLRQMFQTGKSARVIIDEQGLAQIDDSGALQSVVDQVLSQFPAELAQYLAGKEKIYQFFVGEVMKAGKGRFNPKLVNETIQKKLAALKSHA
jgi:aspartyl-tRNA(Asn)/glutamyl-tRNA(Gln) amidotransferase subunit B